MGGRSHEIILFGMQFVVQWSHSLGYSTDGESAVYDMELGSGNFKQYFGISHH